MARERAYSFGEPRASKPILQLLRDIHLIVFVTSVTLVTAAPRIPTVKHRAKNASSIFRETLADKQRGFRRGLPRTDHQNDPVSKSPHDPRVRKMEHPRSIDLH